VRRRLRLRVRRWVSALVLAPWFAAALLAQSRTEVRPSVSVGAVYDENILWQPDAQSDHIWRLTPAITISRDSARSQWLMDGMVEGEWFSRYRDLSTPAARQHASTRTRWQTSSRTEVIAAGGYDNSINPTEINVATGLGLGRVRAWRWFGGPEVAVAVSERTKITSSYQLIQEFASTTNDITTHRGELLVSQRLGERDEFRARYIPEWFLFEGAGRMPSHRALVGWSRRLTPATRFTIDGGVRMAEARYRPDVDVSLMRTAGFFDASIDYAWTQATALGLTRLADVQRVLGRVRYEKPGRTGGSLQGGVYLNDLGTTTATVYSVSAELVQPLFSLVSIGASYGFDSQRGRINVGLSPVTLAPAPLVPLAPAPATDLRVRREVFQVRLIISAPALRTRPAEEPRDPTRDPRTRTGDRHDR